MYFENDADTRSYSFLNPHVLADQFFGTPDNATLSKDANLEFFLGT